jgi:hypothetical protein
MTWNPGDCDSSGDSGKECRKNHGVNIRSVDCCWNYRALTLLTRRAILNGAPMLRGMPAADQAAAPLSLVVGACECGGYFFFGSFLVTACFFCLLTFFGLLSPIVCSFRPQQASSPVLL